MASFGSKLRNGILALLLLAFFPMTVFAQDARQTFTWNKPANFITFNSITDNPAIGDERNFAQVRNISDGRLADQMSVRDGQEIVLQVYFNNNAGANLKLKANNTRVRIVLPSAAAKNATITGYITADNAKPASVSDAVSLTSDTAFSLNYEKGSAQIWNNALRGASLSDAIVSSDGAQIGYDKIDGLIQGGPQYSGYVTIKVRVSVQRGLVLSTGKVPNSGPGDVLAIFLAAVLIGAVFHHGWMAGRPSR
jgi:opacity protein-like surface antigen